jgi:large subunit ribosomal protein L1
MVEKESTKSKTGGKKQSKDSQQTAQQKDAKLNTSKAKKDKPESIDSEATIKKAEQTTKAPEHSQSKDSLATAGDKSTVALAKAGRSSKKGIEETEKKVEKIERQKGKAKKDEEPKKEVKKHTQKPPRPHIERHGKKYRNVLKKYDHTKEHELKEAIDLLPNIHYAKFDESVELHVNLNIDTKQSDQAVRSTVALPHGSGKTQKVAVFAPEAKHKEAKDAGADVVGEDDLLKNIEAEKINFDILIATPEVMSKLGKLAKVLGPKGLMPNPKSGTVTSNVAKAVKELKGGRIEFRADQYGIVHQIIGKVSFKPDQLLENAQTLLDAIKSVKPDGIKGAYVESVTLTTTMGPSIKISQK